MKVGLTGWLGMGLTLTGVGVQSLLPAHLGWSFIVFLAGNVLWLGNGALTRNWPLVTLQIVCAALNINAMRHFL